MKNNPKTQHWSQLDTNLKLKYPDTLTRSFRGKRPSPRRGTIHALADQMLAESRTSNR